MKIGKLITFIDPTDTLQMKMPRYYSSCMGAGMSYLLMSDIRVATIQIFNIYYRNVYNRVHITLIRR